jgi:uroporphyrinogen decarboxylase
MRQAGRYMDDYQKLRKKHSFMELCHEPDLATEITLQPIKAFDMDAAILFCDILVTAEALGRDLDIVEKKGPVIANPVRSYEDLKQLLPQEAALESLDYVSQTLRQIREEIGAEKGLLGFVGAPFTVGSYMIEGGSSSSAPITFKMIVEDPKLFEGIMTRLTDLTIDYIELQRKAGVDALQIFESWASLLPEAMYLKHVFPHLKRIVETCYRPDQPLILFALATPSLWQHLAKLPAQVLSIGPEHDLSKFKTSFPNKAFQGNLDTRYLLCSKETLIKETQLILDKMKGHNGHIFNLGHGITPNVPEDQVRTLVDFIKSQA